MSIKKFWNALRRCKRLDNDNSTPLARCLGLIDLTALGVGSTLGLGVYVLAGAVAKKYAGPAVTLSFLVAAIASAFAGLCYAEFAARVPKAGSAYVYSYVSVGEFIAFTIGWNLILEYVIGTASVAKGMSNYIDSLTNNTMSDAMRGVLPMDIPYLASYPDFLAFGLVMAITVLLAIGVKESTKMNNIFTCLNLGTVVIVVIAGAIKSDPANWNIKLENIPEEYRSSAGSGGFNPFGFSGIMAGAAQCFFGFVGFDCVATTGEEAKNPKRDIPLSIVISLAVIFASYFSVATVLTLMWPYYMQDPDAPFPHVFHETGLPVVMWIVTIGAIFALCTSLLGAMFPLPRVLYAMGNDGVIFRTLANINKKTQTPLLSTFLSGLFSASMCLIFDLEHLMEMMSIGTLLAYTIVAASVLILRYEVDEDTQINKQKNFELEPYSLLTVFKQSFNLHNTKEPSNLSSKIAKFTIGFLFLIAVVTFCLNAWDSKNYGFMFGMGVMGAILLILLVILYRQPMSDTTKLTFKVPLVPLLPFISICMNLYLMFQLQPTTWVRFIAWLVIGYCIYFLYGIRSSTLSIESSKLSRTKENTVSTKF